jgi:hypothetical protein
MNGKHLGSRRRAGMFTACLLLTASQAALAELWELEPAIDVTQARGDRVFHHLDSAGRRSIAVSDLGVAVTWEDDRDGTPRVYLAHKVLDEDRFNRELTVSAAGEAFEPSVTVLENGYLVAWEQDGQVLARVVDDHGLRPVTQLSERGGAQVSLAAGPGVAAALWSENAGRFGRIRMALLAVGEQGKLDTVSSCDVDPVPPAADQLYPSAMRVDDRWIVAWEDRRPGHTIIMAARQLPGTPCRFSEPQRISARYEGPPLPYGKGHGVSRVAMATFGEHGGFAAWADKRNFRHGYDIWGASYEPDTGKFGANEWVQDDFGELAKQRNPSVAGHNDGTLVVAWNDEREGHGDIMLSWRDDSVWSDDWPLPGASGPGQQSHPSIVLDANRNLHAVWVDREAIGGPTRLRYAMGTALSH